MSITSLNFIYSQFENNKLRYYAIYDEDEEMVDYQNDTIDHERALNKLKNFFKENEGDYTIKVYNKKLIHITNDKERAVNQIHKYKVEVMQPTLPQGVNGLSGMNTSSLPSDDPRSNAPNIYQVIGQLSQVESNMKLMEKDHQHYREMKELQDRIAKMEEEGKKGKGMGAIVDRFGEQFSDPQVLLGLISGVSQLFNKNKPMPMAGVIRDEDIMPMNGIDEEVINNISTRRKLMLDAINVLQQSDPNFPENLSKLANLCKNKPMIYSMAVSYLNNL